MHAVPRLLVDLALVLGVAAVTSLLFRWLKLPVVLGYVLAGLLVGPHVPIPLVADEGNIRMLADLGVTLLMFSIGLEFSLQRLFRAGPRALMMGSIQVGLALVLGALAARALGWTPMEATFVGAALSISSTMVVAKLFEEQRPPRGLREAVLSVLVIQDLFAILLLTALSTLAQLGGLKAAPLGWTLLRLAAFFLLVVGLGRLALPRLLRWVADHARPESLLIASMGLCFALAVGAAQAGFSLALGAFLAGMLAAESGRARTIEHLVSPLKDLFSAIFFVAVGMMLNPQALAGLAGPILLLTLLVVVGNALSLTFSGLLAGLPLRTSLRTGLALGQIGEFGYIILGTGIAAGVVRPELYSLAVAIGILTAFLAPGLLRRSPALAQRLENRLPSAWRLNLALYQAWAESLRQRGIRRGDGRGLRGPTFLLLLDSALLVTLVAGHHALILRLGPWLQARLPGSHWLAQVLLAGTLGLLGAWLVMALLRQGRLLARRLAHLAPNPEHAGSSRWGRHLLAGGLRVAVLLMVGLPLTAALQPFAPRGWLFLVVLAVLGGSLLFQWRRACQLGAEESHGAEWLLSKVTRPLEVKPSGGTLRSLHIGVDCPVRGQYLSTLDLPGRAGVTVVALLRGGTHPIDLHPSPTLEPGDLLALTGSESALDEAEGLLGGAE